MPTNNEMNKQQAMMAFIDASQLVIRCAMCGTPRTRPANDEDDLAEGLWKEGWRVQDWKLDGATGEDAVLCQHCKDNQR